MQFWEYSAICAITLLCFLMRFYPRVILKNGFSSDTFAHLKYAENLKLNGFAIGSRIESSVLNIAYSYPYFYHLLLSLFSTRSRLWAERATGAFFDSVNVVIIYIFLNFFLTFHGVNYPGFNLMICLLYVTSPALLRFNGGPRSFNGSPRVLAQTLFLINAFAFYYFVVTGSVFALATSIACGALLFISSTFGTQVYLFFAIFLGIAWTWHYLAALIASLIVSVVFTRFKVIKVLKGHIGHVRFLAERLPEGDSGKSNEIRGYLKFLVWSLSSLKKGQFKKAASFFHERKLPLHNFLFYYPSFFIVFKFSYFTEYRFLYTLVLAAIVCYMLTSLKPFKFLGEAIRYLDYSIIPSYALSLLFLFQTNNVWLYWLFLFYAIVSAIYFIVHFFEMYKPIHENFDALKRFFDVVNQQQLGNLFVFNSSGHLAFYFSKQPIINALIGNLDVVKFPKEESDAVIGNYPMPSGNFTEIVRRFKVQYVMMTEEEKLNYSNNFMKDPFFFDSNTSTLQSCGPYVLLKVNS